MTLEELFTQYDEMQERWEEDDISYDDRCHDLEWLIEQLRKSNP